MTNAPERLSKQNFTTIAVLIVSSFVVILNETIMNVALPVLMDEFNVTADAIQWLSTIFMLTMAVVIPMTGFLLQRMSIRNVFVLAMGLFTLGTLLAALAPGLSVLLVARVIQASGTAIMMPLLMTTILHLVPAERRGVLMGNVSIVISVAPAIGPTVSGLILQYLSWRFMFIVIIPIAVAALLIGTPRLSKDVDGASTPLSIPSLILAIPGFGGLVYGLSGLSVGVTPLNLGILVGAILCLLAFVFLQLNLQKEDKALLDLRPLNYRAFTLSLVLMMFSMISLFGVIILLPMFFTNVLGIETLTTGLIMLPGGLLMGVLAPLVGKLYDKVGARPLIVPGALVLLVSLLGYAVVLDVDTPIWLLVVMHLVMSLGLAFIFTPAFTTALNPLPHSLHSHGSALLSTLQQLAGAMGTALLVGVVASSTAAKIAAGGDPLTASVEGFQPGFLIGAGCSVGIVVIGFLLGGKKKSAGVEAEPATVPSH
ncbi:DHA2 family lincomycin resistance protein-like MFS transporter [Arthrobacter sp. JUb119]|uniref:MDR family MFS transporter n=1 Tax=Micrococcaceae TaxID=1268 RepID=UPI000FAACEB3|nr:MDR family MFS transporter [Arthrobacter sp. JUb115]MCS3493501.1 DHA2 family lincomycin resistance protein-like MFS transporter [Arthrobacter sp. JUb119]TDU24560.1 DHA2 family lincomycin resistance protein-like MFS transporter [Arthrobacter sp. JUb115]